MLIIFSLWMTSALASSPLIKKVDVCKKTPSSLQVRLIKQWHLSTNENTRLHPELKPKAAQNQQEIYEQLVTWVKNKEVDTVLAEGCEGEITPSFKYMFNGWSYSDLALSSALSGYSAIPTHPVLKLEAKMTNQVLSMCADHMKEIKEAQLALSDMRGDAGFLTRLEQNRNNPETLKIYLEGVIETFKLKKETTVDEAIRVVKDDLKKAFTRFEEANHERNLKVVDVIKTQKTKKPMALVFGGLHAADLKSLLEKEGLNCEIYEPTHYNNEETKLVEDFKKLIQ